MYIARIENKGGEALTLSQDETRWQVTGITGLNPPPGQINLTDIAGLDGSRFNSSKLTTRNIVITLRINGDVEDNRQELYNFFRTKEKCRFYFRNANRDVYIDGYVETVEVGLFSISEVMQVSVICPDPYFRSTSENVADISDLVYQFEFPFSIDDGNPIPFSTFIPDRETIVSNRSESETGMVIGIKALADFSSVTIIDNDAGTSLTLTGTFLKGDLITINTTPGQKSIRLLRAGVESNIFSALAIGSIFPVLKAGDNSFSYTVDSGAGDYDIKILFTFANAYRGV